MDRLIHAGWTLLWVLALIVATCFVGQGVWRATRQMRYNQASRRIGEKIEALAHRRPANVDPKLWTEAVTWIGIARGNVLFSEGHASYESLLDFEAALDRRLADPVDLDTIRWLGDRLADTGPHGQRYMQKWQLHWDDLIESFRSDHQAGGVPP